MLIFSRLLTENPQRNLTGKQVEFAETIHASGTDLLGLINEILDLSKIEAGLMRVEVSPVSMSLIRDFVQRNFEPIAVAKALRFDIQIANDIPQTIKTDEQRLQQIL